MCSQDSIGMGGKKGGKKFGPGGGGPGTENPQKSFPFLSLFLKKEAGKRKEKEKKKMKKRIPEKKSNKVPTNRVTASVGSVLSICLSTQDS